jgi:hypothetical protein
MLGAFATAPIADRKFDLVTRDRRVLTLKLDLMEKHVTLAAEIDPTIATVAIEMPHPADQSRNHHAAPS